VELMCKGPLCYQSTPCTSAQYLMRDEKCVLTAGGGHSIYEVDSRKAEEHMAQTVAQ
jgi:hypothetical protein